VAVGRTYKELTGVPENLTQVIFVEVKHGNYFVGSVPHDTDQISVEGHLRTGRSLEAKRSLVERIVEAVAQAAAMPKSHVWAHLVDMPATQIVEFGRVVPEPGGEAARLLRIFMTAGCRLLRINRSLSRLDAQRFREASRN
jgi:phenylpyruvate tautomerase PptA (4-oxalocrotonate tautomerase family)